MTRWLTADHHFYHANIIKYCHRPFKDVLEMNQVLEELWNDNIAEEDEVWHLGDFGFWAKDQFGLTSLFNRLHGRKHLIWGSHDHGMDNLPWASVTKGYTHLDEAILVHDGGGFLRTMRQKGVEYWGIEVPILCGHVHQIWQVQGNMLNVGVDVWHFRPIEWDVAVTYWKDRYIYWKEHSKGEQDD